MNPEIVTVGCRACGKEAEGTPGDRCGDSVWVDKTVLEQHPKDENLGAVIGGKYGIIDVLGVGGFGCVYEAIQEPVGRPVALKLVHKRHMADEHLRQRFFREAKVVAQLTDPTVVTLYDYGEEADRGLYMVFELVRGRTIHQVIKSGPQVPAWTAHILVQVLSALGEAHGRGMIHRDIKPGNIMVVEDAHGRQRARLLDFGIAKVVASSDGDSSLETKEGLVLGTPRYMSPEQARGSGDVDARSDLYSLAVLGYAMLAGSNPFERTSVIETIMAHVQTPPPPLDPALKVPPAFEAVLAKALEKAPDDRFQTAREMEQAIQAAFGDAEAWSVSPSAEDSGASYARGRSVLGAAVSGLATPTPRPGMATPRPFSDPDAIGFEPTQASPSQDLSSGGDPLPTPASNRGPALWALVGVVAVAVMVGLWMWQEQERAAPVAEPLTPAPTRAPAAPRESKAGPKNAPAENAPKRIERQGSAGATVDSAGTEAEAAEAKAGVTTEPEAVGVIGPDAAVAAQSSADAGVATVGRTAADRPSTPDAGVAREPPTKKPPPKLKVPEF